MRTKQMEASRGGRPKSRSKHGPGKRGAGAGKGRGSQRQQSANNTRSNRMHTGVIQNDNRSRRQWRPKERSNQRARARAPVANTPHHEISKESNAAQGAIPGYYFDPT